MVLLDSTPPMGFRTTRSITIEILVLHFSPAGATNKMKKNLAHLYLVSCSVTPVRIPDFSFGMTSPTSSFISTGVLDPSTSGSGLSLGLGMVSASLGLACRFLGLAGRIRGPSIEVFADRIGFRAKGPGRFLNCASAMRRPCVAESPIRV